jgi:hypothetical protein
MLCSEQVKALAESSQDSSKQMTGTLQGIAFHILSFEVDFYATLSFRL